MKKLALTICLAALTSGAFAQGLVSFINNSSMLISTNATAAGGGTGAIVAPGGSYVFALFTATVGTTDPAQFVLTGLYGTNQATAGRIFGGNSVPVTGWAAGETKAFIIRGWSANLGTTWAAVQTIFENPSAYSGPTAFIGTSPIAPNGVAGGATATGTLPSLSLWGGTQGLQAGFALNVIPVPEPSSFALAGLGAAALMIFRRRK